MCVFKCDVISELMSKRRLVPRVVESIRDISASSWDACANPETSCSLTDEESFNPFLSHSYLKALELSGSVGPSSGWAPRYLTIEDQSGKRVKKRAVKHTLDLFDAPDKLWQRFQDLAFHYFQFKVNKKRKVVIPPADGELADTEPTYEWQSVRKDLCPDKRLFRFDRDREFLHIDNCTPARKQDPDESVLKRKLIMYRASHTDETIRAACAALIDAIEHEELRRLTPKQIFSEVEALRRTLALRLKYDDVKIVETIANIQEMLFNDEIF